MPNRAARSRRCMHGPWRHDGNAWTSTHLRHRLLGILRILRHEPNLQKIPPANPLTTHNHHSAPWGDGAPPPRCHRCQTPRPGCPGKA